MLKRLAAAALSLAALSAPPAAAAEEEVAGPPHVVGRDRLALLREGGARPQRLRQGSDPAGFYDGTTFHRVIPRFVVQGGDPLSKNDDRSDDGNGEADRRLKAEFSTTLHYRPGTVGMARDADPDSGSCQFFIALEGIPRLDGR